MIRRSLSLIATLVVCATATFSQSPTPTPTPSRVVVYVNVDTTTSPAAVTPSSPAEKKPSWRPTITYAALEVLPVTQNGTLRNEFSPQFGVKWNDHVSTFTLIEWGDNRGGSIQTGIVITPLPKSAPWIASKSEVGTTKLGGYFQTGVVINFHRLPKVGPKLGKIFKSLTTTHYVRLAGAGNRGPNETQTTWITKSIGNKDVELFSEGVWRARGNGRRDFAQPQGWVLFPKFTRKVAFGVEVERVGGRWYVLPGMKFFPLQ